MIRVIIVIFFSAIALTGAVFGAAASLGGLPIADLFYGAKSAANCDSDGILGYSSTTNIDGYIDSVKVTGIDDDCENGTAVVQLTNDTGTVIAAGQADITTPLSGPPDDNSVDVIPTHDGTLTGNLVLETDVDGFHPLVTGGSVIIHPATLEITITPP